MNDQERKTQSSSKLQGVQTNMQNYSPNYYRVCLNKHVDICFENRKVYVLSRYLCLHIVLVIPPLIFISVNIWDCALAALASVVTRLT